MTWFSWWELTMDYHGCSWDGLTRTSEWFRRWERRFGQLWWFVCLCRHGTFKSGEVQELRPAERALQPPCTIEFMAWDERWTSDVGVSHHFIGQSLRYFWYHLDPSGTIWYLSPFANNFPMAKISGGQGWLKKLMAEGIFAIHGSAGISGGVVSRSRQGRLWQMDSSFHPITKRSMGREVLHLAHLIEEWLISHLDTFGLLYFGKWIEMKQPLRETMELQQGFFPAKGFWMSRTHDPCQLISCRTTVETSWNFWWSDSDSNYQPQICSRTNDLWFIISLLVAVKLSAILGRRDYETRASSCDAKSLNVFLSLSSTCTSRVDFGVCFENEQ